MRTLKLIVTLFFVSLTSIASAQFVNSKSNSSFLPSEVESSYSRAYIGYNMMTMSNGSSETSNGVTIGYLFANNIMGCKLPLYLEYGVEAIWNNYSDERKGGSGTTWETELNFITLSLPINVAYKYMVPNTEICVSPYLGVNLKAHLSGKLKYRGDENGTDDIFDEGDAKRCQLGMNVGFGLSFRNIYIGYRFQPDFIHLSEDTKTYSNMISVGYCF